MNYTQTSLVFLIFLLQLSLSYAQQKRVASVESKDFEQAADTTVNTSLNLTKKERKEFDQKGRLLKHELHLSNPAGEMIMRTSKSTVWNKEFRI